MIHPTPLHVVITPARNEAEYIPLLLDSMVAQTLPPKEWIIVDDNSTDQMPSLVDAYCDKHHWIRRLVMPVGPEQAEQKREVGSRVAKLFLWGLGQATSEWSFVSKIDADLTLPLDYFENILSRMEQNPKLGIAGGACYIQKGNKLVLEKVSKDHTRGALKTYSRPCYQAIKGIRPVHGWDGLDGIHAEMQGYQGRSFEDVKVIHHRPTGSFHGALKGRFVQGQFAHFLGYHTLFMLLRVVRRMLDRPFLIGGLAMGLGFLWQKVLRRPVLDDPAAIQYLRGKQMKRLGLASPPSLPTDCFSRNKPE